MTGRFRFIAVETHTAAMNMALDEACMEAVRDGQAPPTFRLYHWSPSAISLGNFQCYEDEVDAMAVGAGAVPVVRRLTGGGAVYHDAEGEVTYSLIAPQQLFPNDIGETYAQLCALLIDAFAELGVAAEFRPVNDIAVNGKKVSGNAQTRRGGVLLQHGTILLTVDPARMFTLLTPDKSKLSDKPFVASVNAAVTCLAELGVTDRSAIERAVQAVFHQRFPGDAGEWTPRELERAAELVDSRYSSVEWTKLR